MTTKYVLTVLIICVAFSESVKINLTGGQIEEIEKDLLETNLNFEKLLMGSKLRRVGRVKGNRNQRKSEKCWNELDMSWMLR